MKSQSYITKKEITAFSELLNQTSLSNLNIANYPNTYLQHLLTHKKYFIDIYTSVLNEVLKHCKKSKEDIHLVDYGAGNGLLGMYAKFCGFKDVLAVDLSSEFLQSATVLSENVNIKLDRIILGDIHTLLNQNSNIPDAIIGTDVIEHIYDLDGFFYTLQQINPNLIIVFTTASNNKNWLKRKNLMKIQKIDEWKGWKQTEKIPGHPSFRDMRKTIIKEMLPSLPYNTLYELVTLTRGLNKKDIIEVCIKFSETGYKPNLLSHPTNTCDPITGSWTERLLSFEEYKKLFNKHSFILTVKNLKYNAYQKFPKGILLNTLNFLISTNSKSGNYISPLLQLTGTPSKKITEQ